MIRSLVLILLVGALLGADFEDPASEVIVTFNQTRFDPAVVEVRRGVRVVFHSLDAAPGGHAIVAADGSFESWPLGMHGQWSYRFKELGTHEFYVKGHPGTRGRAIVK
jgi:plastocyanin